MALPLALLHGVATSLRPSVLTAFHFRNNVMTCRFTQQAQDAGVNSPTHRQVGRGQRTEPRWGTSDPLGQHDRKSMNRQPANYMYVKSMPL